LTSLSIDDAKSPVSRLLSPFASLHLTRTFHAGTPRLQQKQEQQNEKKSETSEDKDKEKKEESKDEDKSEEKKEDAPPPPPHGDKSPWQVFRDTLQSEFKASKEWNESTKALASSAHQFTESENIKRARAAYEAASGAATTRTSSAIKTTGRAIGKSASWTWNTPVVKGLRKGVNVTTTGLEKATRPVRETEAYKTAVGGVKQAIDDGSSSRYGGWIEKEERRRQRQLREEMEAKSGHRKSGPIVEDPKYVSHREYDRPLISNMEFFIARERT
jgi:import inner membrane translocase subunit TIM44